MNYKIVSRKESILITAIEILDEKGIKGMTTKEIALREGISEPAIYRHYKGKKEIVTSIMETFSRYDDQIIATVQQMKMGSIEGIEYFLSSLADYYSGYPEVVTVMHSMDVFWYDEETRMLMHDIVEKRLGFLEEHVRTLIRQGHLNASNPARIVAEMVYGILMNTTYLWKTLDQQRSLKSSVMKMFQILLE